MKNYPISAVLPKPTAEFTLNGTAADAVVRTRCTLADGFYHYHCSNVNYLNQGMYDPKSGSYYGTKGTFTF